MGSLENLLVSSNLKPNTFSKYRMHATDVDVVVYVRASYVSCVRNFVFVFFIASLSALLLLGIVLIRF
jgi:hypothetical protein